MSAQSIWLANPNQAKPDAISIGDALTDAAAAWPHAEAVVFAHQPEVPEIRWTFAELNAMAENLAAAIRDMGYVPGERIAIWAPNHPHWILLEYALAKAGLVLVAINPLYQQKELIHALLSANVAAVFHADAIAGKTMADMIRAVRDKAPALRGHYSIAGDILNLLDASKGRLAGANASPDDLFMIQYTSGTTGFPKAALLSHQSVASAAKRSYVHWGFGPGDRVCHGFPLFHVGGSGNSTPGALRVGATTLPLHIFRADQALDILEKERCTGFIGVPSMLTAMMELGALAARDLSNLKRIIVGGAPVPPAFLRRCEDAFGVELINGYGQTESSGVSASVSPGDSSERKTRTSGRALPGVSLKVVNPAGAVVECGHAGELCMAGPGKMIGYSNAADSMNAFDDQGWLRTGDLATMDSDGYIAIVGRLKEMIIRGGENLYPAEIERYLLEHPDIADAAVIGLPDEKYGEEVCAVLRAKSARHADADSVREWCRQQMSRWKVPKFIAFVDALPTTTSGKVKKHELQSLMCEKFGLASSHTSLEQR